MAAATVLCLLPLAKEVSLLVSVAAMRRDVQEIFRATPHDKQVMMFSATLDKDIRPVVRKFMQDVSFRHLRWRPPLPG